MTAEERYEMLLERYHDHQRKTPRNLSQWWAWQLKSEKLWAALLRAEKDLQK